MTGRIALAALAFAVVASACAKPFAPDNVREVLIEAQWTAPVSATVATTIPGPIRVRVTDADGHPVSGQFIAFSVTRGYGAVVSPDSVTGPDGTASAEGWLLSSTAGPQELTVHLPRSTSDTRVFFRVTATP